MNKKHPCLIIIFLMVACFIAFGQIASNDFINFDDPRLITENSHVQHGINTESIKWALTDSDTEYWHPLTWFLIMLDWRLFGSNAFSHHLVSLLLHIGATLFLFLFLNKATKNLWPSAFAAAMFALHPLRVESVAWASELKDVLSMFFGMATLYAYAYYVEKPRMSKYLLCLILFSLSIMSKPMMVTLPFVLLLLDYWPLARWQKLLIPVNIPVMGNQKTGRETSKQCIIDPPMEKKVAPQTKSSPPSIAILLGEKVPFFFLSIVLSIMLIGQLQTDGQMRSMQQITFYERIINAFISYISYLGKTFWPIDLAVFYPYEYSFHLWQFLSAASVLLGISAIVIYLVKKTPFLAIGWFWYLGTLFPVIGLLQTGDQAMADRYAYLPSIGITIMLAWGMPFLFQRLDIREKILYPVAAVFLTFLMFLTWIQCSYWVNSVTLYSHALQVTKNNYLAHNNLGSALFKEGKIKKAFYHFNEAIRLKEDYVEAYYNRGAAYAHLGKHQRAIDDYNKTIIIKPDYLRAYNNRGVAYFKLGQYQRAIEDYNQIIRLKPGIDMTYYNIGLAYIELGHHQLAIENFNKAIRLNPNYARAYNNRGLSHDKLNQHQLAIEDFNRAISLVPYYTKAYINRSNSYFSQGNNNLGCNDAQKACELGNCKTLESAKDKGYCR